MRILTLRFKNLNSLTGEWSIDFTHSDYLDTGIFAITGATGAGKSTILDALCLALYGQTPRLGKISKSSNEIMSRQYGECFAEIEFTTTKGTYRCRWGQHRSRKKADGELQNPQHEIVNAENDNVIAHKIKDVLTTVEQVSGMNFDRFTRSMLLAQGSFAAFLQAKPDERAPLLEQITGTGIYSDISKKVHQRKVQATEQLRELKACLQGIQLLSNDEKISKEKTLKEYKTISNTLRTNKVAFEKGIQWHQTLANLENQLASLKTQQIAYQQRYDDTQPQRLQLQYAQQTEQLADEYRELLSTRQQTKKDKKQYAKNTQRLKQLKTDYQQQQQRLTKTQQKQQQHQTEAQQLEQILIKVRDLDTHIQALNQQRKKIEKQQQQNNEKQQQLNSEQEQLTTAQKTVQDNQQRNQKYLQQHPEDATLVEHLAGISLQLKQLQTQQQKSQHSQHLLAQTQKKHHTQSKELTALQTQTEHSEALLKQHQQSYKNAEQELAQHLQQQSLAQWRQNYLANEKQYNNWQTLEVSLKDALQLSNEIEHLKTSQHNEQQQLEILKQQQAQQQATLNLQNEFIEQLNEEHNLQRTLQSLEQHRKMLVDNEACPLCGALEHPYHKNGLPTFDSSQKKIKQAKATLKKYQQQQQCYLKKHSQTEEKIKQITQQVSNKQARLDTLNIRIANDIEQINQASLPNNPTQQLAFCQQQQQQLSTKNQALAAKIEQAEKLEQRIKQQKEQYDATKDTQQQYQQTLQAQQHQQQILQAEIEHLQNDYQEHINNETQLSQQLSKALQAYGIVFNSKEKLSRINDTLKERQQRWKKVNEKQDTLEKQQQNLDQQQIKLTTEKTHLQEQQQEQNKHHADIQQQLDDLKQQRRQCFGNKDPQQEAKRCKKTGDAIQHDYEILSNTVAKIEQDQQTQQQQQQQLEQDILTHQQHYKDAQTRFTQKLSETHFTDEASYLNARVSKQTLHQLQQQEAKLKEEKIRLDTRKKDLNQRYQQEQQRQITEQSLTNLQEEVQQLDQELSTIERKIGAINEQLNTDKTLRQTQAKQLDLITAQTKEVTRWDNLHALIGSADGKKFRNFAQGLTFEIMIVHANQQLTKMNDRYLLKHNGKAPLELNIIDNYQASEERSIKNLSGGESFIVSLALALGLSQMASQQISIDSLFLDEGFGTLDEETLETALEALAKLHQDNKLIGIISHVARLKQRIPTQIHIIPDHQGRSRLSGPGVAEK